MKKLFSILVFFVCISIYADNSFDPTRNYQGLNAQAYVGEILTVKPFPKDFEAPKFYRGFKNFDFDPETGSENSTYSNYKFGEVDYRDQTVNGTRECWLAGKSFKIDKVYKMQYYDYTYVFEMHNVNNVSEKVKYVYHSCYKFYTSFYNFPFYVKKHIDYLKKSLIGNEVVIGTVFQKFLVYETNYYYKALCRYDINTGETIRYDKSYAVYTVKNVEVDKDHQEIALILTDGKHTVKELYSLHYDNNPITYNTVSRIFTKGQWDAFVKNYGISHMEAIMNGDIVSGMTMPEAIIARGKYISIDKSNSDFNYGSWSGGLYYKINKKTNKIIEKSKKPESKLSNLLSLFGF